MRSAHRSLPFSRSKAKVAQDVDVSSGKKPGYKTI